MKIINLREGNMYSSNVYLVQGSWKSLKDTNSLIDVGRNPSLIEKIREIPKGLGKKHIERVVLTHNHYDHASLLPLIKETFNPQVYAFSHSLQNIDHYLSNKDVIHLGDQVFEIIHAPGHSSDSIILLCKEKGIVFTGDNNIFINPDNEKYEINYLNALEYLLNNPIKTIYPGHGNPITHIKQEKIQQSLLIVQNLINIHQTERIQD